VPDFIQLVLLAFLAPTAVAAAIIAAWRMIPYGNRSTYPTARLEELEEAVEAIRLSNIELADKYEITIRRNNVRVGRLRRKVAKLRDDDVDQDDDDDETTAQEAPPVGPVAQVPAGPLTKAQMWQTYLANQQTEGVKQ